MKQKYWHTQAFKKYQAIYKNGFGRKPTYFCTNKDCVFAENGTKTFETGRHARTHAQMLGHKVDFR